MPLPLEFLITIHRGSSRVKISFLLSQVSTKHSMQVLQDDYLPSIFKYCRGQFFHLKITHELEEMHADM